MTSYAPPPDVLSDSGDRPWVHEAYLHYAYASIMCSVATIDVKDSDSHLNDSMVVIPRNLGLVVASEPTLKLMEVIQLNVDSTPAAVVCCVTSS